MEADHSACPTPVPLPLMGRGQVIANLVISENLLFIWREALGAVGAPCTVLRAVYHQIKMFHLKEGVTE